MSKNFFLKIIFFEISRLLSFFRWDGIFSLVGHIQINSIIHYINLKHKSIMIKFIVIKYNDLSLFNFLFLIEM